MIRGEKITARKKRAGQELSLPAPDYRALFEAVPDPSLVLDREFRIVAVNNAYLKATRTTREDILGQDIREVFPDNPNQPASDGAGALLLSLKRVFTTGNPDTMAVQRYDIPISGAEDGGFEERYWNATNTAVLGSDGKVSYIIHRVRDITDFVQLKQARMEEQKVSQEFREKSEAELYAISREVAEANQELRRTIAALDENRKLFDSFLANLPAAAWINDRDGRYLYANAEMCRVFSCSVPDLVGKTGSEVFPAELADQITESDLHVLREGASEEPFQVVRQAGGGERYLMVTKFPIPGPDGKPHLVAGLAFDVTEKRRLEAEVERLASYPIQNPNPVVELDLAGNTTFSNSAANALVEDPGGEEGSGNPFVPRELPEIVRDLLDRKIPHYVRELEVGGRWFEEHLILTPDQSTIRCYTMDISRRKKLEREREQLLLQLEAVLENINEGVVVSDLSGTLLTMNKEALALHEFTSVAEVRRHMSEFLERFELTDFGGRVLPLEEWPLARALRGERFTDYEMWVTSRHSGRAWVGSYSGTPVVDKNGDVILALVTLKDISERKELEEQVAKLNADLAARVSELEEFNQDLEGFNRMVSHDLRQPLNTIGTSCQAIDMLCGHKLDEDCKRYVTIAYDRVRSMNELIGSLIAFSRSTHGQMNREDVNLSELAQGVASEVTVADPGRQATFKIAENVRAKGDPGLLRSVLDNLIGNAWKYTSHREETVIEFGSTRVEGEEVFFVRDNGRGFDMADAPLLFAPFKRLPGAQEIKGFGIGLATVERIIRRHGGRIWAESEAEKGATFYFTLPAEVPSSS